MEGSRRHAHTLFGVPHFSMLTGSEGVDSRPGKVAVAVAAAAAAVQTRKEGKDLGHSPSEHMATGHLYGRLLSSG